MSRTKIFAMIPARIGSKRLKKKNLALLNGKPLISYSISAAKKAKVFNKIIINSDSKKFKKFSKKYNVDFYLRPKKLGKSNIKSDEVVLDFLNKFSCDICVWVNPISPLQTGEEIKKIVNFFIKNKLNSLITVEDKKVHSIYKNKPINFRLNEKFKQTQDMIPIRQFVYSIMMWTKKSFIKSMKLRGNAILHKKIGYFSVGKNSSLIVKTKEDIELIEQVIKSKKKNKFISYYK